jgi:hypothetical protein
MRATIGMSTTGVSAMTAQFGGETPVSRAEMVDKLAQYIDALSRHVASAHAPDPGAARALQIFAAILRDLARPASQPEPDIEAITERFLRSQRAKAQRGDGRSQIHADKARAIVEEVLALARDIAEHGPGGS